MENLWILIPLVAIIGGFLLEYQKHKAKTMDMGKHNEQEVEDLAKLVNTLKNRIENLEAIAAEAPEDFNADLDKKIEIDESALKKENREDVSKLANNLRTE